MSTASTSDLIVVTRIRRRMKYLLPSPDGTNRDDTTSRKGPLCVGAAQIIVALVILGLGSFLATQFNSLFTDSYVFVWAPLIFIGAGCYTMAAGWTAKNSLVRKAIWINVAAAVVSFITFMILLLGIILSNNNTDPFTEKPYIGLLNMSPFLAFLEMAWSICVAQRCCGDCAQQPIITIEQQYGNTSEQAPPPYSP